MLKANTALTSKNLLKGNGAARAQSIVMRSGEGKSAAPKKLEVRGLRLIRLGCLHSPAGTFVRTSPTPEPPHYLFAQDIPASERQFTDAQVCVSVCA